VIKGTLATTRGVREIFGIPWTARNERGFRALAATPPRRPTTRCRGRFRRGRNDKFFDARRHRRAAPWRHPDARHLSGLGFQGGA